ncbi:pickpocket protein 28-like [Tenebrio molitor]|uniref:pickpocket protein 28-like n=1 Tax=Tenebrio molitor TaxID=7067 RepID=UPI0036249732
MTKTSANRNNHLKKSLTNVRNYFKQYCASTSIHGFRYFGEDRTIFEKIWWFIIFVICLSGCGVMIFKIYEKYDNTPVIVTFATRETPLYKIPFPAITICPEVKSVKRLLNFTDLMLKQDELNLTDTERKNLEYMTQLCDNPPDTLLAPNTTFNNTFTNEFFETLDQVKPVFMILECSFLGQDIENCEDVFTPVFTDEGICYSFNILDRGHIFNDLVYHYKNYHKVDEDTMSWNMEQGYLDSSKINTYPWRALLSGASNGFTVYLGVDNEDIDFMCKQIQGFKVVLHSPVRMPRLNQEYFRIPLDHAVVASVQPVVITTSQEVKTFDVAKRDCYFPSERKLKYFRTYSQQNCQLECLTNITLDSCGCVNFFMPRENSTEICGLGKYKCIKEAEQALMLEELNKFRDFVKVEFEDCDCLPLCTDLSYNIETSHTKWDWKELLRLIFRSKNLDDVKHLSSLTVYFRVNHFISSERHELYGPTDFVANFGGLLGLFTGFSILSLMEIIYFLTVRICCNVRLHGRWTGVDN